MTQTSHPEYVGTTVDACEEVAGRLEVVALLIREAQNHSSVTEADRRSEGTGGYELNIANDVLDDCCRILRTAAKAGA